MSATIYVEGGGSRASDRACRAAFRRLWERCGFRGRLPKMFPSGSRASAYEDFRNHVAGQPNRVDYVAMLIDSEDPVSDVERTWDHLGQRDGWRRPRGATDDQVLFMTTCMETWIVADRVALRERYSRGGFNENALPPPTGLESRRRQDVQTRLGRATRGRYRKGEESFRVLGALNPERLEQHLPSFQRARRILDSKLS